MKVEAVSLNRRDLLLVEGIYNPKQHLPVIPCSDCAGTIVALGAGVTSHRVGERVAPAFFPSWQDGDRPSQKDLMDSRGGPGGDGVLADYMVVKAEGAAPIPPHLTAAEASTLPCAALTAWSAIVTLGQVRAGDQVLVQGTGGVSLFALQFAKARGAVVTVTSSSPQKLAAAKALGADHGVNYRDNPRYAEEIRDLTGGLDHVVEVGGAETLDGVIRSIKPGGTISLIGVLSGPMARVNLPLVVMRRVRLQGVTVGSLAEHKAMCDMISATGLKPVIGATYSFDQAREAFAAMGDNSVFGKIVITV